MGSLFKLRDHWYSRYSGEEFGHVKLLAIGNVDNKVNGESKIVLGSFTGILRILQPVKKGTTQPEDTLVEKEFGEPILQVACRPLESTGDSPPRNLVIVLLQNRLVLLRLLCVGGSEVAERGKGNTLSTSYRLEVYHDVFLERSSYNFTFGRFGYSSREMICVQSLDGVLTIVDQKSVIFHCFLPRTQFMLPGCLAYSPYKDCFLTNNSAMTLMCYPFSTLSNNMERETLRMDAGDEQIIPLSHEEHITPAWSYVLGEDAVGIEVCRHTRGVAEDDADIVVLCQHTLFVLTVNGELRYAKRLDVESLCLASYYVPSVNACNLLIGTVTGLVQVHSATSLEWSAKMASGAPLFLEVAELMCTKGLIVSLSTEGILALNYLGTDPEDEPIQPLESREADYAEMDQELRRVQCAIQEASNTVRPVVEVKEGKNNDHNVDKEKDLYVMWECLPSEMAKEDGTETVTLTLRNDSGNSIVGQVIVCVQVVEPVQVTGQQKILSAGIPLGEVVRIPFCFTTLDDKEMIIPSSLDARAVVMYTTSKGVEHTVSASVRLPFSLVARPIPSLKNTEFVMQLNTNIEEPPSLLDLFPDVARFADAEANILTFQYVNGADATVLVSKNAGRFRLQGSTMEALWLLADELQRNLRSYYGTNLQLSVPEPISVENYYAVIDTYLAVGKELFNAQEELSHAAQMLRAVQKRLLLLFRERSPTPVGMMEVLFEEIYSRILRCTDDVSCALTRHKQASAMLCCCSRLMVLQLVISCSDTLKNPEEICMLESIFTCPISGGNESSWEEVTDASLGYLLFGSNDVPASVLLPAAAVSEQLLPDTSRFTNFDGKRLKKRIGTLFDRLLSGLPINSS